MRRHWFAAALATGVALLACTACTSSIAGTATTAGAGATSTTAARDPATGKPEPLAPDQVGAAIKTAYQGASAVHVKGSESTSGSAASIDLQLNKDSGSGTFAISGATFPLSWVNGVYYVQCSDTIITMMGLSPTGGPGAAMRNKWLSSDSRIGSSMVAGFKDVLTYSAFMQNTVGKIDKEKFTAAGSETINGVPTLAFKTADGTTAYVASSNPHYVMRISGPTSGPGPIDFTGWNRPVAVNPPPASEIYSGPGS